MNLANKLTIFRIFLIPLFILLMYFPNIPHWALWSLFIFALASFTDHLDGRIARSQNLITNFGIFLDPFADKLLVITAIVLLVEKAYAPAWVAIIIIAREFAVSGLRTISAKEGHVIAASNLGKLKTVSQMLAILFLLLKLAINTDPMLASWRTSLPSGLINALPNVVLYLAALMTLYSGVDYFIKGWHTIDPTK